MKNIDYYKILNITRDATEDEIKNAYRRLAFKHHPDQNPADAGAEDKFKEINEAYEVLGSPEKRKMYDIMGSANFEKSIFSGNFSNLRPHNAGANFSCGRGRGCRRRAKFSGESSFGFFKPDNSMFNNNAIFKLNITLEEANEGTKKIISAKTATGVKKIQLNIKPGIEHGAKLKLSSKYEDALLNDMYVQINIHE